MLKDIHFSEKLLGGVRQFSLSLPQFFTLLLSCQNMYRKTGKKKNHMNLWKQANLFLSSLKTINQLELSTWSDHKDMQHYIKFQSNLAPKWTSFTYLDKVVLTCFMLNPFNQVALELDICS